VHRVARDHGLARWVEHRVALLGEDHAALADRASSRHARVGDLERLAVGFQHCVAVGVQHDAKLADGAVGWHDAAAVVRGGVAA